MGIYESCGKIYQEKMEIKRYDYIDRTKGLAILLVVMGHVLLFSLYMNGGADQSLCFKLISQFHMPLFIFLSGLVVKVTEISWSKCATDIWKRIRTLLVPFFVFGVLLTYTRNGNVVTFITAQMKYGYWYLWVLFELYLLHYVYRFMHQLSPRIATDILTGLAIMIVLKCMNKFCPIWINNVLSLSQLAQYYPYFFVPVLLQQYHFSEKILNNKWIFTSLLIGSIIMVWLRWNTNLLGINTITTWMLILFVVCWMKQTENVNNALTNFLKSFGKNSLLIYVIHYFIVLNIDYSWLGEFLQSHYSIYGEFIITVVISLIIAIISIVIGKLLNQLPYVNFLIFGRK